MRGWRINPAWQNAIYQQDFIGPDGKVINPHPFHYPRRGNKIVNGEIVDPICPWIEVDDLPDLEQAGSKRQVPG